MPFKTEVFLAYLGITLKLTIKTNQQKPLNLL